jgi:formate dehydrogenase subunit gamma
MSNKGKLIERYTTGERRNHWFTAITFILLALSGLALFHPSMYWLTSLFGGGQWTRILHPFIGVLMFLSFLLLALRFWRHNLLDQNDRKWLGQVGDVINAREERLPPVGRYNAGQKMLFWVLVLCMLILLVSGIIIWQPYFAPSFSITLVRFAVMMHALSAFVLILAIIVHIYAAIWVRGSTRAITRGTVTRAWAKKHHPLWYREVTGEGRE